jgi:endonuclease-3
MQPLFAFCGSDEIVRWRSALAPLLVAEAIPPRRKPIGALVKSLISGRTRDADSLRAYHRLCDRFGSPGRIAEAGPQAIAETIFDVAFAEAKAEWLAGALRRIAGERRGFGLDFLGAMPMTEALAWLERLPGVGRKVSAATLNASTLDRPVMIVDSHVLRVLQRLGFVGAAADARAASEAVTAAMADWSGEQFLHFHVVAKRLGQRACHAALPGCGACPLARECPGRLT